MSKRPVNYHFERESVSSCIDEMAPLLRKHYEEISHYPDIPLEPDLAMYKAIEATGQLRVFTARDEEKKLLGYAVFFVRRNLHYASSLQASQDIIYIDPERRGFGRKFIAWCDRELQGEGVQVVYHHLKAKHNFGPMLERMNYDLVDLIYAKRLDRGEVRV